MAKMCIRDRMYTAPIFVLLYLWLAKGREEDAAAHLRQDTPFGEVLGYICNHPCESACQRHTGCHDGALHVIQVTRHQYGECRFACSSLLGGEGDEQRFFFHAFFFFIC